MFRMVRNDVEIANQIFTILEEWQEVLKQTPEISNNQLNQVKALSGSIAHEMRNPLSAIQQCADEVESAVNDNDRENALMWLNYIKTSSQRGLKLINIILNNIRDNKINADDFEEIEISSIIDSMMDEYAFEEGKKELVNIDLKNDFTFKGDKDLALFILFNLVKNSLYYSGTKININLSSNQEYNILHFQDHGKGIADDKLPFIFESFMTSGNKQGTGLGLPFCKRAMKAFDGDIICKSTEGQGAEFILYFPKIF